MTIEVYHPGGFYVLLFTSYLVFSSYFIFETSRLLFVLSNNEQAKDLKTFSYVKEYNALELLDKLDMTRKERERGKEL